MLDTRDGTFLSDLNVSAYKHARIDLHSAEHDLPERKRGADLGSPGLRPPSLTCSGLSTYRLPGSCGKQSLPERRSQKEVCRPDPFLPCGRITLAPNPIPNCNRHS